MYKRQDYNSLIYYPGTATNLFYYDVTIANTGISNEGDIIIEFYCLNGAGDDIIGAVVNRDTLTSLLLNGDTDNLTGEFKTNCDPQDGLGVLIVPEYDNCYCDALESMANKTAGLSEIPHDVMIDIPPFTCSTAITNPHVAFLVRRKID